jgi:hypothetical protein
MARLLVHAHATQGSPEDARVRYKCLALWVLIGVALAARVILVILSEGSNDVIHWKSFSYAIRKSGLLQTYRDVVIFNHPPLAGYWAAAAGWLSLALDIPFSWLFKIAPFVADLTTAHLLWRFARSRGPVFALGLATMFLWSPIAILVSCFHANTDPLLAAFLLMAAMAADSKRPLSAGLALAAAVNVKIVAVFAAPVLLIRPTTWRNRLRIAAMASLGIVPFLPILIGVGKAFIRNGVAYNSNPDAWGIRYVLWHVSQINRLGPYFGRVLAIFDKSGRWMILAMAVIIGLAARGGKRSALEATSLVFAAFLVLAPGFGLQYTIWIVPFLFAVAPLRTAVGYSLVGGIFLALTYIHFWRGELPALSWFTDVYPDGAALFGFWAWAILAGYLGRSLWAWARGAAPASVSSRESP